jgi:hypothetical protein
MRVQNVGRWHMSPVCTHVQTGDKDWATEVQSRARVWQCWLIVCWHSSITTAEMMPMSTQTYAHTKGGHSSDSIQQQFELTSDDDAHCFKLASGLPQLSFHVHPIPHQPYHVCTSACVPGSHQLTSHNLSIKHTIAPCS